mgnify:CR=1 FL=1
MPMSYIYAKRFIGPITPTILALREELYDVPYNKINWNNARISCCKVCYNLFKNYNYGTVCNYIQIIAKSKTTFECHYNIVGTL